MKKFDCCEILKPETYLDISEANVSDFVFFEKPLTSLELVVWRCCLYSV